MTISELRQLLIATRSSIIGDFTSTSRVVDTLLDLRHLAESDPETTTLIDSTLSNIPGRSVVTNDWWRATLEELDRVESAEARTSASVNS